MIQAAIAVPDHAGLRPWRFIEIPTDARAELADVFVACRKRQDPDANAELLLHERDKAHRSPTLLCVCAQLQPTHARVSVQEQLISVGASIQNLLLFAHVLGYGAIMLSGNRVHEPALRTALELTQDEVIAGFVSIGTIAVPAPSVRRPSPEEVFTVWRAKRNET